ncbi:MAG: hypothetical protein A3E83_05295 [Gammaproteobacteria bacterium RIFCSPHIGHO2_12_FULL_41_20]|nr:MAG: hypothetical protein A3E83_05295 [Gammaproteobacteria bacterium RIFCSPHIGHO2_12_FULL_41_20]
MQARLVQVKQCVDRLYQQALPEHIALPGLIVAWGDELVFRPICKAQKLLDAVKTQQVTYDLQYIEQLLDMVEKNIPNLHAAVLPYQQAYQETLAVLNEQKQLFQQQDLVDENVRAAEQQLTELQAQWAQHPQVADIVQLAIRHIAFIRDHLFADIIQQAQQSCDVMRDNFVETCKTVTSLDALQAAMDTVAAGINQAYAVLTDSLKKWQTRIKHHLKMVELVIKMTTTIQQFIVIAQQAQQQITAMPENNSERDALLAIAQEDLRYLQTELTQQLTWVIERLQAGDKSYIDEIYVTLVINRQKIEMGQATYNTVDTYMGYLYDQVALSKPMDTAQWRQELQQVVVLISCSLPHWHAQVMGAGGVAVKAFANPDIPDMVTVPRGIAALLAIIRDPQYQGWEKDETLAIPLAQALWNQAKLQVSTRNMFRENATQQMYQYIINNLSAVPQPVGRLYLPS